MDIDAARERATELLKRVEHRPWRPDQPFEQAVSELKRSLSLLESDAAERLRTEELYRTVVNTAGSAILVCDADLHLTEFNREAERIFGYERRDVIRDSFVDRLVSTEARDHVTRLARRVAAGDAIRDMELPVTSKGGLVRVVLWNATRLCSNTGAPTGIIAIGHDITDRKHAEDNNRFKASALAQISDAIVAIDKHHRIIYANAAAERLYERSAAELIGRPLAEVHTHRWTDPEQERAAYRAVAETGHWRGENLFVTATGREVPVESTVSLLRDGDREPIGLLAVIRDISERRRSQQALHEVEEKFRHSQKMEAIGRFAGGIAHDFNNLLLAIQGRVGFLLRDRDRLGPLAEHVEGIRDAAMQATTLTRQLLTFSRQRVARRAVLSLNRVIEGLAELIGRLIGDDVELRLHLAPDLGQVCADHSQLEQVLMNFVVNARDAMPDGGQLTLQTANCEGGRWVELTVTDSGVGMNADTLRRIFEPFFTTKPEGRGTGLGLSTVCGIVRRFGGQIEVESKPGGGSRFRVRFPQTERVPEPTRPIVSEAAPIRTTSETVLLVEDNPAVRIVLEEYLRQGGYDVLVAANGAEACALADRHADRIAMLVSDIVMPGMSGRDLAERLRAAKPDLRVLYMSGYAASETQELQTARSGFLQKPFDAATMLNAIRTLFG